jgi:radical SAM superfamily enzyme YgiQ (UPF0313 family)
MIKILTLNPPFIKNFSRSSRSPAVTKGGTIYFPIYLSYATGNLEKHGFETKLVDAVANGWSHEQTLQFVRQFKPDLALIDTSTPSIYNDVSIAFKIKETGVQHVSLVGTHPTRLDKETLELDKNIDSVCRGEYDETVVELAKTLEAGKSPAEVKGLTFRQGQKIIKNPDRPLIKDLDALPFVSEVYKRHLDIKKYFYASLLWPQVTLLTARGCPYNCSFCNIPFKASYRFRSPENVVSELEYIESELPYVREVMIEDDTFPVIKERTEKICRLLVERKIRVKWSCNARVNTDLETLKLMKKANCRLLCVGFETPRQNILDSIHKNTTKELQVDFMKNTRRAGLLVNGCFILGLPGDTKDSIRETIEFAKELNPDTAQFYPLMVYPGTEAYEWAKRSGSLLYEDYSKWITKEGLHSTAVSRPELSSEELVMLCDQMRSEYYLRGGYIFSKMVQSITNPRELERTLKALKTFSRHLFRR